MDQKGSKGVGLLSINYFHSKKVGVDLNQGS